MTRFLNLFILALDAAACGASGDHATLPADARAEVLSRYLGGEALEPAGTDLRLVDRDGAGAVAHDALLALTRRFDRDR